VGSTVLLLKAVVVVVVVVGVVVVLRTEWDRMMSDARGLGGVDTTRERAQHEIDADIVLSLQQAGHRLV
jgi:hypothetical protein